MILPIFVKKLRPDAILPEKQTKGAAGADLHAILPDGVEEIVIHPEERRVIGTGLAIALPPGWEAQVRPRSGLAAKNGITVLNTPGTIDEDYRGEIGAILINHGTDKFVVKAGDRIAQMIIAPIQPVQYVEMEELTSTDRGAGGLGSTGVSK